MSNDSRLHRCALRTRHHGLAGVALVLLLAGHPAHPSDEAVSRARAASEAGHYASAATMLEKHLAGAPNDVEARFLLARVLAWDERWADAIGQYDVLLAEHPDSVDYLHGKAQVLVWSGRPEEALPLLERARALAPDYESIWQLQTQALLAADGDDHRERASALTNEARRRFPDSVWPLWEEPAAPDDAGPDFPTEIEAGVSYESLNSGQSDWRSVYVEASRHLDARRSVYGVARSTDRFDDTDVELTAGGYLPVTDDWTTALEGSVAPGADILPRWSLSGRLQRPLARGFGLQIGMRHARYENDYTNLLSLTGDRYWGNAYVGYTLYASRLQGAGTNFSHQIRLDRYYGDRNRVGVLMAVGDETESVGGGRFVTDTTATFVVGGRHWFVPLWAVSWELIWHDQGDAYTRGGARVGVRHQF
jgi:YaiO family outer membrane protein